MLTCAVSLRPVRHMVAADIVEIAGALDNPTTGAIHATLVDNPGNARDILDAFTGQRIVEAANATATIDVLSVRTVVLLEEVSAAIAVQDAINNPATTWVTFDPALSSNVTLSSGNLIATNIAKSPTNQGAAVAAVSARTNGKYYFEATFITFTGGDNAGVGVGTTTSTYSGLGNSATIGNTGLHTGAIWANGVNTGVSLGLYGDGQIASVAVDLTNRKIWFRRLPSGNWNNSGTANPATNTGGITIPTGAMVPFVTFGGSGGAANNVIAADFGAAAFSGAVPSGFTPGWPAGLGATVVESVAAASTEGATVVPAGAPLDGIAGLTGAWSFGRDLKTGFSAARYTKSGTAIITLEDQSGNNRDFTDAGVPAQRPVETTAFPTSVLCADFDGIAQRLFYSGVTGDFISASSGAIVVSVIVDAFSINNAIAYRNAGIIADVSEYIGLFARDNSGISNIFYAYNWDGSVDVAATSTTMTAGTPYVLMWRHHGGNLYLSVNGGTEISVASGSTTSMAQNVYLASAYYAGGVFCNCKIAELFTTNDGSQTTALATAIANMKTYIGA